MSRHTLYILLLPHVSRGLVSPICQGLGRTQLRHQVEINDRLYSVTMGWWQGLPGDADC